MPWSTSPTRITDQSCASWPIRWALADRTRRSPSGGGRLRRLRDVQPLRLGQRKTDQEPGIPGPGLKFEVAVVFVDDNAPRDIETEPCPLAERLGREEGLEYSRTDLFGHARSGVPDCHRHEILVVRRPDGENPRTAHG